MRVHAYFHYASDDARLAWAMVRAQPERFVGAEFLWKPVAGPADEAARLHLLADHDGPAREAAWMESCFTAQAEGQDLSDPAVLDVMASRVGLQDAATRCNHESLRRLLAANTAEAIDAGHRGLPFFVVEDEDGHRSGPETIAQVQARFCPHGPDAPAARVARP